MSLIEGFILFGIILYILYKYGTSTYEYWEKKGVPHIKARIPFLGINFESIYKRDNVIDSLSKLYNAFPGQRFGGFYMFRQPSLIIRDLELIKKVTIKDFDHYVNRNILVDGDNGDLLFSSLVALRDKQWRDMRNILSPTFTSSKMKNMFVLTNKCGEQMTDHLDEVSKRQEEENHPDKDIMTFEMKQLFRRFTNDVIATSAFGVQINSLKNPENDFYKMGERVANMSVWIQIKFLLYMLAPTIMKVLKVPLFDKSFSDFFRNLVRGSIKIREEQNIIRPDLIHLLMLARKGKLTDENDQTVKRDLTDDEITSQALFFFFAGFESASVALCFVAQELAENQDVQKRLQDEIDQVIAEDKGITYEGVMHKVKYLDMVVNESLRKWPPGPVADRQVTSTYVIPETKDNPEIVLDKGTTVLIPIAALHRNPEYYPDPEKFDPERFNDENRHKMDPFTFLPFGSGPRNCIGMRFALMEVKSCLVHLLHKYSFRIVAKSQVPLKLSKNPFQLNAENGFWLGLKPRAIK